MGETDRLVPAKIQHDEKGEGTWTKGENQPAACHDVIFALLFLAQFAVLCYVAGTVGMEAFFHYKNKLMDEPGLEETIAMSYVDLDYTGVGKAAGVVGGLSFVLVALMGGVMIKFSAFLIKLSIILSCVCSLASAAFFFHEGYTVGAVIGLVFFALTCCYARCVWSRIDFATANLVTGFEAVRSNFGITLISYFASIIAVGFTAVWALAFIGVYDSSPVVEGCEENTDTVCNHEMNLVYVALLLLSFYWAHQVFKNIVHTSVAGTVGTWWFVPEEASSCCSSAVSSSVCRSCTYSFGSICFGSLLVAIVQTLRALVQAAKQEEDGNQLLVCILDCILSCIQGLIEYFNKWAYVYVGIYGYGYLESGKKVMAIFKARGWDSIIADDLVDNCLALVNLLLGLMIGSIGLVLHDTTDWFDEFKDYSQYIAFFLSFLIGLAISSISFSIVDSSVNAVIVLYAEAPAEFANHHPTLSSEMRDAYMKAHPDVM
jgi:hypothetical protein